MPRLFNAENFLFQTFAVASVASNATATATFTGVTTDDFVFILNSNDVTTTAQVGLQVWVSAADTVMFKSMDLVGSAVISTVGVGVMVNPTSGQDGGSW